MELRGRLPGSTRFASGAPSGPVGCAEKSVSWLFRTNPSTMWNEPNADSTVVVIAAALPYLSTTEMWLVPCSRSWVCGLSGTGPKSPGCAVPIDRFGSISAARCFRYSGSSSMSGELPGSGTKSESATYLSRSA